ncbi:Zinc finger CCCH domain-containing protein 55 [Sesamum angolense]|uniref:Zinc finger CCCH domain-containing protein 55 n=1 Tax=Sesamum angolense TaxID=2727404 RepID=A0AAE1X9R6_9LAMI|nr:Zinc finger CCCH domain-containing protein 55 [Sesamum angolense]
MYFARGFCKNGSACKFLHSEIGGGEAVEVGSPSKNSSGFDELLRVKALQQQRFALMASGGHHPFAYNKSIDFLNEHPRSEFSSMGFMGGLNSSSRQIYLTFPADSTFKEEDVSNYFSMFGPVQDVRIPYQQKRMFGFVTFVYAETVKLILAKGNPHFVCDSRVLVKPYKEKGKIPDKYYLHSLCWLIVMFADFSPANYNTIMLLNYWKQQQQQQHLERGEFSACLSPSGIESRDHNIDLPFDFDGNQETAKSQVAAADRKLVPEGTDSSTDSAVGGNKQQNVHCDDSDLPESLEHILPDNLFASPTKSAAEHHTIFSQTSASADDSTPVTIKSSNNTTPGPPGSSPLGMASLKSCYIQMPRFSSGQEAIEM